MRKATVFAFLSGLAAALIADQIEFARMRALQRETAFQRNLALQQAESCVRLAQQSEEILRAQLWLRDASAQTVQRGTNVSPPAWVLAGGEAL